MGALGEVTWAWATAPIDTKTGMTALGVAARGVAHAVNTPEAFIAVDSKALILNADAVTTE